MTKDPGETKNLIDNPNYAATLGDLRQKLQKWESQLEPSPTVNRQGNKNT